MAEMIPTWQQPSHPDRIRVQPGSEPFSASAYSLVNLPAGSLFAKITSAVQVEQTTYTSVATGKDSRIELNSDLVYCNHSCDPSLVFDMAKMEVRVADNRPLQAGDALTFFYPSTEWTMVQPFQCTCAASDACLGTIAGSSHISVDVLQRYWVNEQINSQLIDTDEYVLHAAPSASIPAAVGKA